MDSEVKNKLIQIFLAAIILKKTMHQWWIQEFISVGDNRDIV